MCGCADGVQGVAVGGVEAEGCEAAGADGGDVGADGEGGFAG